ncbi:hypothetical protein SAMN04489726_2230 [Allokutzneria albata]|uniref:Uncharacterized protein n=1 Tax=Allokutzneria albata TaxID=211114 RepID=A0A1G9U794_ALLAB|nr:hypothetical protein SAMN04489726_2230 [Allokutzneria albata]
MLAKREQAGSKIIIRRALRAAAVAAFTIASMTTATTGAQADPIDCPHDTLGCLYDGDLGCR